MLDPAATDQPAQHQAGDWAHIGERRDGWGNPAILAQCLPGCRWHLTSKGRRPATAVILGQDLPLGGESLIDVGITPETRIRAHNGALPLGWG